jgi:hypothetical protein
LTDWRPHPGPQENYFRRYEFEVFWGGQAGPGKTEVLIVDAGKDVKHPHYRGLILRRTFPELEEIIDRCHYLYPSWGGEYKSGEHRWYFPSGATIKLGQMQHEDDKYRYRGMEYQFIGFDEATRFTPTQYIYLFSRARSVYPDLKPRVRAGSNPGGPSHAFFKDRFRIGVWPDGKTIFDEKTGLTRVFIKASLEDNPTLLENDPEYVQRLMMLPEIERMRLLEGVWDAFEGQAIPELNPEIHRMEKWGISPDDIPPEWPRYRTCDWGYATPFSIGWWAVDPDGVLLRFKELYGSKGGDAPNTGLRMTAIDVAREIRKIEKDFKFTVRPGPADPDLWNPRWSTLAKGKKMGVHGIYPAEDMQKEGITFIKADNDELRGRQQVHKRLEVDEEGKPQMLISDDCKDFWRTIPLLQEDEKNPEKIIDKAVEDHIYKETKYMCMFRPIVYKAPERSDVGSFQYERRRLIKARQLSRLRGMSIGDAYGRVRG